MEPLSVRNYRNNLAASFIRADNGERVLIRRRNQLYALINIGREDLMITPELNARIAEVEKEYRNGNCVKLSTTEDLDNYLAQL